MFGGIVLKKPKGTKVSIGQKQKAEKTKWEKTARKVTKHSTGMVLSTVCLIK
jgi:hypothetical protein